jgi:hypothetical protein
MGVKQAQGCAFYVVQTGDNGLFPGTVLFSMRAAFYVGNSLQPCFTGDSSWLCSF